MSEQEFELYLKLLSRCLGLTSGQREQISDELRDHLEERLEELAGTGVPRDQAVLQALDEFGDAAVLAGHFTTIAHLKRRRFLMRLSLGSVVALAAALLVAFAFWPENHAVRGPQVVLAQNKIQQTFQRDGAKTTGSDKFERIQPLIGMKATPSASKPHEPAAEHHALVEHPLSSDLGKNPKIEEALEAKVDFTIDPQPLKDAMDFIAQRYQIPILLDTKSLEDASVDSSAEVRMPYSGMKVRQLLTLLLQQGSQPLAFYIEDGILRVSTSEQMRSYNYVVVYDCRDLIHLKSTYLSVASTARSQATSAPNAEAGTSAFSVPETAQTVRQFGGAGAGNANGGGDAAAPKGKKKGENPKKSCSPDEIPLIRVIKFSVDASDWSDDAGAGPSISEIGGLLVVSQNFQVHEQIKCVLADLRRMKKEGAFATLDSATKASVGNSAQEVKAGL
jgi:hypothetical protein